MAIKLLREFKQNQQLSITPQLKKSIDLLQLSRLEIINKINNEIDKNPFLEKDLENTLYTFVLDDGKEIQVAGNEEIEYDGEIHTAANLFDALKEGYYGKF